MSPNSVLKARAKSILSNSYWIAFLVCLVGSIIAKGVNIGFNFHNSYPSDRGSNVNESLNEFIHNPLLLTAILGISLFIIAAAITIGTAYALFVAEPIVVGKKKFFLNNRTGKCDFVTLFFSFRNGRYLNIVKGMAWRFLFTFLWTLLFIIPGIVKAYAYSMTPYILADNPDMDYGRALKLSMNMTHGFKADIFVLQLSFIGWYILGTILCCVGVMFVNPYYEATMAEMYGQLRKNAIMKGICSPNELNLTVTDLAGDNQ